MPARRRSRRSHRRDTPRSTYYKPIEIDSRAARRGVQMRLVGAIFALVTTLVLAAAGLFASTSLVTTMTLGMAVSSFSGGIALLLSARREEMVHQLAHEMHDPAYLDEEERRQLSHEAPAHERVEEPHRRDAPGPTAGADGSI